MWMILNDINIRYNAMVLKEKCKIFVRSLFFTLFANNQENYNFWILQYILYINTFIQHYINQKWQ